MGYSPVMSRGTSGFIFIYGIIVYNITNYVNKEILFSSCFLVRERNLQMCPCNKYDQDVHVRVLLYNAIGCLTAGQC